MTNVPTVTFGPRGFVAPSEEDILSGVLADMNAAFGGNLNVALTSPQGQLATSQAAIIGNCNDLFCNITQQVDPAYASGRMQDAIGRIYFLSRNPALPTVVQATCSGAEGVEIPAGAIAKAADGNLYYCDEGGTISADGTITLSFFCATTGPISCPAHTLTIIYQAIPGWDSIDNPTDGVLGQDTEYRAAFEARRAASVALNSRGSIPSVLGAVLNVSNVLDAYVTENTSNSPVTIGGVSLAAHSIYVAAVGGTNLDVATAIWSKKAPGCAYNGNTDVTVEDSNSGYNPPYPSYTVTFERPASLTILFDVKIIDSAQVPDDAATQIQNAIISAFAGEDGGPRARIGSTILASRFYSPIAALGTWALIQSVQIGSTNSAAASFTGDISGTALTVSSVTGTIAIGQTVVGDNVLPGTVITAGSGTSWVVNNSQTVASEAMYGCLADQDSIAVNIDQAPTVAADNIAVSLV